MDRDTLQDDLDQILGPRALAEPIGEWDWEPPLGTASPVTRSADEPETDEPTDGADEGSDDEDEED